MKAFIPAIAAALVIGAAAPALAQVEIVVPGGTVEAPDTAPRPIYNDDYVVGTPADRLRDFDPEAYAINALRVSNFFPRRGQVPFNVDRAVTLNATGESIAEHQLRCQAAYASYELASDTFLDANGIPQPCRL